MLRTFGREFKLEVCDQVKLGRKSKSASCREHSLSPSLLDRWMAPYKKKGLSAFGPDAPLDLGRRVKELEASLGRAHLENEFLKEALGKLGIPDEKVAVIHALRPKYLGLSLFRMCQLLRFLQKRPKRAPGLIF